MFDCRREAGACRVLSVCIIAITLTVSIVFSEVYYIAPGTHHVLNSLGNSEFSRPVHARIAICVFVISRNQGDTKRLVDDIDRAFRFSIGVVNASLVVIFSPNVPSQETPHVSLNWTHGVVNIEKRGVLDQINVYGIVGDQVVFFLEDHMEVSMFCVLWILSQLGVVSSHIILVGGGTLQEPSGLVFLGEQWDSLVFQRQFEGVNGLATVDVLNNLMSMNHMSVIFSTGMYGEQFTRSVYQTRMAPEVGSKLVRAWNFYEYQQIISSYM